MSEPLNTHCPGIALIGAGMIAERHVMALSGLRDRVRLTTVLSRHPERAQPLAEAYEGPAPRFTDQLSAILDDPGTTTVIMATPPSVRLSLITELASAGKHILLEKPIARNLEEAEHVVDCCEKAGVTLAILFQHRVRASSLAAREWLDSGRLGRVGHVEVAIPLWRDQSYYDELGRGTYARDGGGVLLTQGIHTLDLMLSLTGSVSRVQAMTATTPLHQMEAEDLAVAGLHFTSGAVGSVVASTATFPHGRETITLHAEKGSMRIQAEVLTIHWRDGSVEQHPAQDDASGSPGRQTPKHEWHQAVITDFLDAVVHDRKPLVSGREGLAAHALISAIETSSRTGMAVNL